MITSEKTESNYINRKSGIELLKIIGILLVVISHVTQTLGSDFIGSLGYNDYYINLDNNTNDFTVFCMILFRHGGVLGNTIFFVCSAWFLLDKNTTNYKKIFRIICDAFVISVLWLIIMISIKGIDYIGERNIIRSFFPISSGNNWYVTTYIFFCFISPFLNLIIKNINQKTHFAVMITLAFCYLCIDFLYVFPNSSALVIWISIYFVVTYFKLYGKDFCNNVKFNFVLFLIAFFGGLLLIVLTNVVGIKSSLFKNTMQRWAKNNSIINFVIAFSLFNVFSSLKIKSKFINYVSSCSLLIYIVHENILFRAYVRPYIWQKIFLKLGYDMLLLWHACYVIVLFLVSLLVAFLYKTVIQKTLYKLSDKIYTFLRSVIVKIADKIYKKIR